MERDHSHQGSPQSSGKKHSLPDGMFSIPPNPQPHSAIFPTDCCFMFMNGKKGELSRCRERKFLHRLLSSMSTRECCVPHFLHFHTSECDSPRLPKRSSNLRFPRQRAEPAYVFLVHDTSMPGKRANHYNFIISVIKGSF
ncbi:rCG46233 [Rattus norvegicus]|uniref:RCG46233 n=1 Tax=Rattus norvegicus TaxID=10116 RepID=A6ID39_RAT|nr:rCG46233 [Rattus norvegicus]